MRGPGVGSAPARLVPDTAGPQAMERRGGKQAGRQWRNHDNTQWGTKGYVRAVEEPEIGPGGSIAGDVVGNGGGGMGRVSGVATG